MNDKLKSLYVDSPTFAPDIKVDDFVVSIGVKKSNSIYHVAEVRKKHIPDKRVNRFYLKVYMSDLLTLVRRDPDQRVIPMRWYKREKKKSA